MTGRNYGGRRGPILTYPCTNCIVLCQRLLNCSSLISKCSKCDLLKNSTASLCQKGQGMEKIVWGFRAF